MADTKNQDAVTGDKNSVYAAEGGYGPGPELAGDDSRKESASSDSKSQRTAQRTEEQKKSDAESSVRPPSRQQTTEFGRED